MVESIPVRTLGQIAVAESGHIRDECPRCGSRKLAASDLCQACHLREKAHNRREIKALAKYLTGMVARGDLLIIEPGNGSWETLREVLKGDTR